MYDMREMMKKLHRLGRYGGYGGLKTMVLYTLSEQPKNGVEIMDAIETMSFGHWKPSPGSIYPLLKKAMTEENLIRKRDDGRYELTPEGAQEIGYFGTTGGATSTSVDGVLSEIDSYISYLEDLPPERVAPHREQIARLIDRMGALARRG
ncbi:MAG: PadR family transcriptional regulator [Methanospirillum sp.]